MCISYIYSIMCISISNRNGKLPYSFESPTNTDYLRTEGEGDGTYILDEPRHRTYTYSLQNSLSHPCVVTKQDLLLIPLEQYMDLSPDMDESAVLAYGKKSYLFTFTK